jgi:large subunit ribosomal protein L7Ae
MPQFVKYNVTEDLANKLADFLGKASKTGKIKAGVNEVTKMLERGQAKLVVMAEDVTPEELLYHIPVLCNDKKIPFSYAKDKKELGKMCSLKVGASCVAVINEGVAKKELEDIAKIIKELIK